ncbi:MAG: (Na+)-NQR maturation NqrM [Pseudomonadales bacterium]|nr:(Na+)-NQR maturation NqrM [Pseudomonadales bacterium]
MATFIFALCFLLLITAAMAVGVIFANKPIKGSCGGIQALGLGQECDICGGDPMACDKEQDSGSDKGAELSAAQRAQLYSEAD